MKVKESIIQVSHIHKSYQQKPILNDISFDISQGEIFGLLGPSGAGKTTLIRLLIGLEKADKGRLNLLGHAVPHQLSIKKMGYTAQADALYLDLSAEENLELYCELYGVPRKKWHERMEACMNIVNLKEYRRKIVKHYSGGMKRRLSLAISLLHEPELLILDEPTVGMDPLLRQNIWLELYRLRDAGVTILITTHVMDEAAKCSKLALLRDGACIAIGTPKELLEHTGCETLEDVFLKMSGGHNDAH